MAHLNKHEREVVSEINPFHFPCVSITVPFNKESLSPDHFRKQLTETISDIEKKLLDKYPAEKVKSAIKKLETEVAQLDFQSQKKGAAIFVSPLYAKTIYLDNVGDQKVIVDQPFEIRDLIYGNHQNNYMLLVLSADRFKIFMCNNDVLKEIKSSSSQNVAAYENDIPEVILNFTDSSHRKEIMLDKFMYHIDQELTAILKTTPLPVFVLGTERTNGHYKMRSHNQDHIVEYIHGNYEDATVPELKHIIQPHLALLQKKWQEKIDSRLQTARDEKKLVWGIHEVWRYTMQKRAQALFVEKDYFFPSKKGESISKVSEEDIQDSSYLNDAVDVIIENVIENGGTVDLLDNGVLDEYEHIALIQFY